LFLFVLNLDMKIKTFSIDFFCGSIFCWF
jgi:hypothetical protein